MPVVLIFSQCLRPDKKSTNARGTEYAGSAACISCHKAVYNSYLHTAHYMALQPADQDNIQGSFAGGSNQFIFNTHLKVNMTKTDSGFFQTVFDDGKMGESRRFDVVFGGVKGQTYGYWLTNELFQLPISYVSNTHSWVNSPGYDPNSVVFERMIDHKCLGCHASYAKPEQPDLPSFYATAEGFDKSTVVYGVDCERCHGPAAEHVRFQTANPQVKTAKYITTYNSLTREQKINMCAICHSGGNNHLLKPTFGFKPGDTLENYIRISHSNAPTNYRNIDVHGNQRGLLESSKCFISSNMDCATCHDTHTVERGNTLLYAARCNSCHSSTSHNQCKLVNSLSTNALNANCVACHMPAFTSKLIVAGDSGAHVHTHHIAIYSDEAQKVLSLIGHKRSATTSL
jgi:hypothetical protein